MGGVSRAVWTMWLAGAGLWPGRSWCGSSPRHAQLSCLHFNPKVLGPPALPAHHICSSPSRGCVLIPSLLVGKLRLGEFSALPEALRLCDWKAEALSPDLSVTPSPTQGLSVIATILIIQ